MTALRRVLVVWKRSAYDIYVRRHRMARVRELLRRGDVTVERMRRADEHHARTLDEVRAVLGALGIRASYRPRDRVGATAAFDLVITVGGDGTLLWASHAVGSVPMLGVNSAPLDSVGFLCGASMGNVAERLAALAAGQLPRVRVTRMRVSVDERVVHRRVLNDVLFAHPNPAMTSRYIAAWRTQAEEHKSSGIWIATPAGSTAAIRSAGGRVMPLRSRSLQWVVREAYTPDCTALALSAGRIRPGERLEVYNKMREARVYVDGARLHIAVEIGQRLAFDLSDEPLVLVGVDGTRGKRPAASCDASKERARPGH